LIKFVLLNIFRSLEIVGNRAAMLDGFPFANSELHCGSYLPHTMHYQ